MNDNISENLNLPSFLGLYQFLQCIKSASPKTPSLPWKWTLHREVDCFYISEILNGHRTDI